MRNVDVGEYAFYDESGDYSDRTLHVPCGTAADYQADENWYPYFWLIVEDFILGDVNGDGEVNIADVNALMDIILGGEADKATLRRADVNSDKEKNIADINALIDIILKDNDEPEHEWVDLGLPSGTLWATVNLGASSPEGYGDYFAWGETAPKEDYTWESYKWCEGTGYSLTKYCTASFSGIVDNKAFLDPKDDAAQANWGTSWRIPTRRQIQELCEKCNTQESSLNGVKGLLITGPNGNTIFLPAAGCRWGGSLDAEGSYGNYWASRSMLATRASHADWASKRGI